MTVQDGEALRGAADLLLEPAWARLRGLRLVEWDKNVCRTDSTL
jgi:hypothetical protein